MQLLYIIVSCLNDSEITCLLLALSLGLSDVQDDQGQTPLDYAEARQLSYCKLVFLSYQKYQERLQNSVNRGNPELNQGSQIRRAYAEPNHEEVDDIVYVEDNEEEPSIEVLAQNEMREVEERYDYGLLIMALVSLSMMSYDLSL